MSSNIVVLITGANRGIGHGLLTSYLARPDHMVIAGVRDPTAEASQSLLKLPAAPGSRVIVVKIDASSETDAAAAIKLLEVEHGVTRVDIVIPNSGISAHYGPISTMSMSDLNAHVSVNAIGPLMLYQAVLPLLQKSSNPKFVTLGSPIGSIGGMELRPYTLGAYGASKALLHYFTRKAHFENDWLVAFAIDPGFVQTDMGNEGARSVGLEKAFITTQDCVGGLISVIDGATRQNVSGHFAGWDGGEFPW